jgi:hypothetical protein
MNGTAPNYLNGELLIGSTTNSGEKLQVTGTAKITGATYLGSTFRIGYDVSQSAGGAFRNIQISGTDVGSSSVAIIRNSNDISGAGIILAKTRSTTNGGTTIAQNGDNIGTIGFSYSDGTALQSSSAFIIGQVDGTPSAGNVPGRLVFHTVSSGLTSVERMRLDSNGNLCIGVTSGGDFLNIAASTTAKAQINLAAGTAPTTPNNGDIWFDGTNLKMQIGGVTKTFTLL